MLILRVRLRGNSLVAAMGFEPRAHSLLVRDEGGVVMRTVGPESMFVIPHDIHERLRRGEIEIERERERGKSKKRDHGLLVTGPRGNKTPFPSTDHQ